MKALILNSGMGTRMGVRALDHPKCMTEILETETILSRQLRMLAGAGISEIIMTTGHHPEVIEKYCSSLRLPVHITFVKNPDYDKTNYIYSIFCARNFLEDDLLLLHGDLVFEAAVLHALLGVSASAMVVSSLLPLPQKDFKAVVRNGMIEKIGVEFFECAMAAQPLYKLKKEDWYIWLQRIIVFCERGERQCYAEKAFNEVSGQCRLEPLDIKTLLCSEIDNEEDYVSVSAQLAELEQRSERGGSN